MGEEKVWFENSKGQKLCGFLHTPEGTGPFPAVVLVHGFGGVLTKQKIYICAKS